MSLFTRIVGKSESEKISPHAIQSMISEVECGRLTLLDITDEFNLNQSEQQDLINFINFLAASPNKTRFSSRVFNYLCLGEMGMTKYRDYTDEALFWDMLQVESSRT